MFLNFIFQPHWRYSERGAGPARWRNRFDNTPKKVLSGGSVRPKTYYQAVLSKLASKQVLSGGIIKTARYPTALKNTSLNKHFIQTDHAIINKFIKSDPIKWKNH